MKGICVKPGEPQGPGEVSMGLASNEIPITQGRGKGKVTEYSTTNGTK